MLEKAPSQRRKLPRRSPADRAASYRDGARRLREEADALDELARHEEDEARRRKAR